MTRRRSHTVHRWRVISRCTHCRAKLLSGCSYRSRRGGHCIAVRDERRIENKVRVHYCGLGRAAEYVLVRGVRVVDMAHAARLIFGDLLAPGITMGVGE